MSEPFLGPWLYPQITRLVGQYVTVERLDPRRDCADLFHVSHTPPKSQELFRFMSFGPFDSPSVMQTWLEGITPGQDPLYFSVLEHASGRRVGMISLLNIVPAHGRCELGNIWYAPQAQKTRVNSEVTYLFLRPCSRNIATGGWNGSVITTTRPASAPHCGWGSNTKAFSASTCWSKGKAATQPGSPFSTKTGRNSKQNLSPIFPARSIHSPG